MHEKVCRKWLEIVGWGCYKRTIKMLTTLYCCLHHGVMSFKQFVLVCYCPCTAVLSTTLWLTSLLTRTRTQLCTVWTVNWISGVILLVAVYWTIPLSDLLHLYYILHTTFRRPLFTIDWTTGTTSEFLLPIYLLYSLMRLPPNSKGLPHCVVYFFHTYCVDSKLSFKLVSWRWLPSFHHRLSNGNHVLEMVSQTILLDTEGLSLTTDLI